VLYSQATPLIVAWPKKKFVIQLIWLLLFGRKELGKSVIDFKHNIVFESPLAGFCCSCSSLPPPLSFQLLSLSLSLSLYTRKFPLSLLICTSILLAITGCMFETIQFSMHPEAENPIHKVHMKCPLLLLWLLTGSGDVVLCICAT
jgi:hypothetical protein